MKLIITIEIPDGAGVVVTPGDGGTFRDLGRESRPEPKEIKVATLPKLPAKHFKCACGKEFMQNALSSQARCECGMMADLAAPPEDDTGIILCSECGKPFKKGIPGTGRMGTCPDCTMVRCPQCRNPASFSEMKDGACKTCRGDL